MNKKENIIEIYFIDNLEAVAKEATLSGRTQDEQEKFIKDNLKIKLIPKELLQ